MRAYPPHKLPPWPSTCPSPGLAAQDINEHLLDFTKRQEDITLNPLET